MSNTTQAKLSISDPYRAASGQLICAVYRGDDPVAHIYGETQQEAKELAQRLVSYDALRSTLEAITKLNGNLPLGLLDGTCGPNDGAARGSKLRAAIEMARAALA